MDPHRTPDGKSRAATTVSNPQLEVYDHSTTSDASHQSHNPNWVKNCMTDHRILRNDGTIDTNIPQYEKFKETVQSILLGRRQSTVKKEDEDEFVRVYNYCQSRNEATFKINMLSRMIKTQIKVAIDEVYEMCSPHHLGVVAEYEQALKREYLPHRYVNTMLSKKEIDVLLKKEGMANAVPDGIWGFDPDKLPKPADFPMDPELKEVIEVAPTIQWPFYFLECKCHRGDPEECRNQAGRGGATVNNAACIALRKMGRKSMSIGPDLETYLFSSTIHVDMIQYWIHWVDVRAEGLFYHMDELHYERFAGPNMLARVRAPITNILEWGLFVRMPACEQRHNAVYRVEAVKLGKKVPGEKDKGRGDGDDSAASTAKLVSTSNSNRKRQRTDTTPGYSSRGE